MQGIVARAAADLVIARAAADQIVAAAAAQGVVEARAGQLFDIDEGIARRFRPAANTAVERDRHRAAGARIVGHVGAAAAIDGVGPAAGNEGIVARPAQQAVAGAAGADNVGKGAADHPLDAGQQIALGIAARAGQAIEVDLHRHHAGRIVRRVDPRAAVEHIGPAAADQRIVARPAQQGIVAKAAQQAVVAQPAFQRVGILAAGERIVEARADQPLDPADDIARRIAALPDRAIQPDLHRRRAQRIVDRVEPVAAHQGIGPGAAQQGIVAIAAVQQLGPRAAAQHIVERRTGNRLHIGQRIALGIAAMVRRAIQPDIDRAAAG